MRVLELFMHTAACAVRDGRRVWKQEEIEPNRAALREDATRRRMLSQAARLNGRHDEADSLWREAILSEYLAKELARGDDPSVIRYHVRQRRNVPSDRSRDSAEIERMEMARGVLAVMHALARDIFGRPAPEVAAAFASAATGVTLTRDDVRRITLKEGGGGRD